MIEVGDYVYGGRWPGDEYPIIRLDTTMYMIRMTNRGLQEAERLVIEHQQKALPAS